MHYLGEPHLVLRLLLIDRHVVFNVLNVWGGIGILKVVSLTGLCLGSKLLDFPIHVDSIWRGSTILSKMTLTPTLVTVTLKLSRSKVTRFELVDSGPRLISPCTVTSLATGSHLSCHV